MKRTEAFKDTMKRHVWSSDDVARATHVLARNEHVFRAFSNKKIFFQFKIEKCPP
jgi:hypothetical protein